MIERCYQHFALRCTAPACMDIERKVLLRGPDGWRRSQASQNAPEVSWAWPWRKEQELAQQEKRRLARMAELGLDQPVSESAQIPVTEDAPVIPVQKPRVPDSVFRELDKFAAEHGLLLRSAR